MDVSDGVPATDSRVLKEWGVGGSRAVRVMVPSMNCQVMIPAGSNAEFSQGWAQYCQDKEVPIPLNTPAQVVLRSPGEAWVAGPPPPPTKNRLYEGVAVKRRLEDITEVAPGR